MALSDEIKREHAKLKNQSLKAKWNYFWEYYKFHTAGVIFAVIFVVSMAKAIITSKDTGFGAVFINPSPTIYVESSGALEELAQQYADFAGIDTKEYNINLDMAEYLTLGFPSGEQDYAVTMKVTTQQAAGELDVMVADAYYFHYYAQNGTFIDLREIYTEEELESLPGEIFYVDEAAARARREAYEEDITYMEDIPTAEEAAAYEYAETFTSPDPSSMEEPVPYGIIVSDASFLTENQMYPGTVSVLAFMGGSSRQDAAKAFLEFIYQ